MSNQPEPYIVQRYIHNPLLIGNKKFDLRIYVLVVSHNPLTIYLYRSGFGRFTHYRYDAGDINNSGILLKFIDFLKIISLSLNQCRDSKIY
jgi:tubulin polyglutamylase TTLL9